MLIDTSVFNVLLLPLQRGHNIDIEFTRGLLLSLNIMYIVHNSKC